MAACLLIGRLADDLATFDALAAAALSFVALADVGQLDVPMMSQQHLSTAACLQCFDEISAVASQSHSSTSECG